MLPLALKWAEEDKLPVSTALARVTCDAARILGIDAGHLAAGADADICVFDPECWWKVDANSLKSMGKNTPFSGLEIKGRVTHTLVAGQVAYELK